MECQLGGFRKKIVFCWQCYGWTPGWERSAAGPESSSVRGGVTQGVWLCSRDIGDRDIGPESWLWEELSWEWQDGGFMSPDTLSKAVGNIRDTLFRAGWDRGSSVCTSDVVFVLFWNLFWKIICFFSLLKDQTCYSVIGAHVTFQTALSQSFQSMVISGLLWFDRSGCWQRPRPFTETRAYRSRPQEPDGPQCHRSELVCRQMSIYSLICETQIRLIIWYAF